MVALPACGVDVSAGHISAGGAPFATTQNINKAYAARDACLIKYAGEGSTSGVRIPALAQAIAARCKSETDALILSLGHADSKVAAAIREETVARAMAFAKRVEQR
jgi:hypothetical protein